MKKKGRGGRQAKAGRYGGFLSVLMAVLVLGTGCGQETEENRTDIDFTVIEPEKVPEELAEIIQEHREEEMQLTFSDGGGLYAVRGYGKQDTGGYSITVDECAEGEEQIYVATTLLGPPQSQQVSKDPSYPVIVIKMENREKEVVFE